MKDYYQKRKHEFRRKRLEREAEQSEQHDDRRKKKKRVGLVCVFHAGKNDDDEAYGSRLEQDVNAEGDIEEPFHDGDFSEEPSEEEEEEE